MDPPQRSLAQATRGRWGGRVGDWWRLRDGLKDCPIEDVGESCISHGFAAETDDDATAFLNDTLRQSGDELVRRGEALGPGEAGDAVDSTGLAGVELEYSIPADWLLNSQYVVLSASWVSDNKSVAFADVQVGEGGDGRITLWATWQSNLAEGADYVELKMRPQSGGTVLTKSVGASYGGCL